MAIFARGEQEGIPTIKFGEEHKSCPKCGNKEIEMFIDGNVNTYAKMGEVCGNGHKFNIVETYTHPSHIPYLKN